MGYDVKVCRGHVACSLSVGQDMDVCKCEVSVDEQTESWNISSWFTKPQFMGRGFGKKALGHALSCCLEQYGSPSSIKYTWNGMNPYVLEWLERHFDAVCTCPIAVRKYQADDDWSSHIYELDKDKVFEYFGIRKG